MKNLKISFFSVIFLMLTTVSYAQLYVDNFGRTKVGVPYSATFDESTEITMALFGSHINGSGARLSFGNYQNATNNGMNLFIGEYKDGSNWDSDILQIHGKNAIFLTGLGHGSSFITKFHTLATNFYTIETGDIVARSIHLWSDNRLKKNMKTLSGSLNVIKRIRGVSYDLITTEDEKELAEENKQVAKNDKEASDMEKVKKGYRYRIDVASKNHFGFSAQEVQIVLPEAVEKNNDGTLAVDYIRFIPLLVEGMKEQQKIIEDQAKIIEDLQKDIISIKKKVGM